MLGEQLAPFVGEQRPVRLDGVLDLLGRPAVPLDERHGAAEEVHTHQRGLAALPRHGHGAVGLAVEQLAHVGLEQLVGHPEPVAGVQRLLRQEEAVLAVEVADRSGGLGQQVERHPGGGRDGRAGAGRVAGPGGRTLRPTDRRRAPGSPRAAPGSRSSAPSPVALDVARFALVHTPIMAGGTRDRTLRRGISPGTGEADRPGHCSTNRPHGCPPASSEARPGVAESAGTTAPGKRAMMRGRNRRCDGSSSRTGRTRSEGRRWEGRGRDGGGPGNRSRPGREVRRRRDEGGHRRRRPRSRREPRPASSATPVTT